VEGKQGGVQALNVCRAEMDKCCCRYNRIKKRDIQVPFLEMYQYYNAQMGSEDLLDNLVSVNYRMKKWWYPFYIHVDHVGNISTTTITPPPLCLRSTSVHQCPFSKK
jgi:hypothetical protein